MVADSTCERSSGDGDRSDDRPDRGQVILIGAVALAFIVLGVVVVFNGVLYTETLSSGETSQSASSAEATELEVRQGIACLAAESEDKANLTQGIQDFDGLYQNATAHAQPAAVTVDVNESTINYTTTDSVSTLEGHVTVTVSYDSSEQRYNRTLEVAPEECPS
ncbi:hypothetical protein HTZ84_12380 [Haloterrigena sp. SYSU A558-1]|uniref:Uncharacterized protein n=1 Tax=Haloterrigena gelatinilytica TaxID=2741724 RepID=A0A8J8KBD7_9EURY|nr:hypothetical protein [Haloterrigena gelatinilytica]NUB91195.1 hypothetical protein [Haloterrigena gelatinilytica]NUC73099.1 hypothetical protein [Haloterrigena gelatinilytica]